MYYFVFIKFMVVSIYFHFRNIVDQYHDKILDKIGYFLFRSSRRSRNILNSKHSFLVPQQQRDQPHHHYCPRKQFLQPAPPHEKFFFENFTALIFKSARSEELVSRSRSKSIALSSFLALKMGNTEKNRSHAINFESLC